MARYTGPVYKKSRQYGFSILENGKELAKKPYRPGEQGQKRRRKQSDYGVQLNEKQKVRFMYGLNEKQFKKVFTLAGKMKGVHGENLLKLLESRLDNLVYRIGFAKTRKGARQLVNHGHILVNGKRVDIPSYLVKPGDVIAVRENKKELGAVKVNAEENAARPVPEWLEKNNETLSGKVIRLAAREDIDIPVEEHLIVELYSR